MTRVRDWKWPVSFVGISALLLIMGLVCLPDRVRASAFSGLTKLASDFETELTTAFSSPATSSQSNFHSRHAGATPNHPEIAAISSPVAVDFNLAHRVGQASFLPEFRHDRLQGSIPDIAAGTSGNHSAEAGSIHDALLANGQSATNFPYPNERSSLGGAGGPGGAGGMGGASGSGGPGSHSAPGLALSKAETDSSHLKIDSSQVPSAVSSSKTDKSPTTIALAARSRHSRLMNGEIFRTADGPSANGGTSGEGGVSAEGGTSGEGGVSAEGGTSGEGGASAEGGTSNDAGGDTVQSSAGSGTSSDSSVFPGQDSGNKFSTENSETTLLRDLGSESRPDGGSLPPNGGDDPDAGYVGIATDSLDATLPGLPAQTESGDASGVITEGLFGSDDNNGPIADDLPAMNLIHTFDNTFQPQDQTPIDAPVNTPEPSSLLLFGTALFGLIAFAKIKGLWQSQM